MRKCISDSLNNIKPFAEKHGGIMKEYISNLKEDISNSLDNIQPFAEEHSVILSIMTFYLITATIALNVFQSQLHLATMADNGEMTLLALKFLLITAGAISIFIIYKLILALRDESLIEQVKKSPVDESPIKDALLALESFFSFFKERAETNPYIMMIFGFLYLFPTIVLMLYFYGNPTFTAPVNWLLNHCFLPTAHGLIKPGHAPWIAALATGFLYAKLFFLIADAFRNKEKSFIYKNCYEPFCQRPFLHFVGLIGLIALTQILLGISFFTHLSGSWLLFNLITIMIKVLITLYDVVKRGHEGIIFKLFIFPFRIIKHLMFDARDLLKKSWSDIKKGIYLLIVTPFKILIWPSIKVYLYPIPKTKKYFDKFEEKCGKINNSMLKIVEKISFANTIALISAIYFSIPLISIIMYGHFSVGPAFNWYNKLLLSLHNTTSISVLCFAAAFALISVGALAIFTCKESIRNTAVIVFIVVTATISTIHCSTKNIEMSNNVTYIILIAISICLAKFIWSQSCWLYKEFKIGAEDEKRGPGEEFRGSISSDAPRRDQETSKGPEGDEERIEGLSSIAPSGN